LRRTKFEGLQQAVGVISEYFISNVETWVGWWMRHEGGCKIYMPQLYSYNAKWHLVYFWSFIVQFLTMNS
jgi:hypothetical protein